MPSIPTDDVDMDSFAEDNAHTFEPPAHLAARFYSKSGARRKSSAHSSRRSSLSSCHSHQSQLSCHGGPYSTHIAQHLRRASIIESRKARLADRAAHAEQVRLRAAIAKAAPRALYSEERALAAQAAREKLLAEITARCEEEVRRAKKIAEETKEKKAAEHARLKEDMAEKFAEAARRRSIYQLSVRRPRTASLVAVEEKKVNPAALRKLGEKAAAKTIQRSWRLHRQRKAISGFEGLRLDLAQIQSLPFEDLTRRISEEQVLLRTSALLKTLGLLDTSRDEMGERGGVRVFLSAYMILTHPVQAFSHGGKEPQEVDLIGKGRAMLVALEKLLEIQSTSWPQARPLADELDNLAFLFNDFSSAFHTWRTQDLGVIIGVMVNSFVNLDLILQTTKDDQDGNVADDYFQAVRHEQIKLLARLKKLAGPEEALSRVRSAVRKARKQQALKRRNSSEQHVPRTSSVTNSISNATSSQTEQAGVSLAPNLASPAPGASSFISRLGQTMTVLPSNREIAHEIQMNGTYEVQQQPWTDSRKDFMQSLRQSMRESMDHGGNDTAANWTHAMAILIKDKLLNLISERHPLYDRIDGFLDPKLIEQQCRNGMFSYASFFETVADFIAQLCSPGRDEAVKAFIANRTSETIDRLFDLINIIDLMTLDHINFQFRMVARSVVEHGHEHEHSSFERDLQDSVHTLEKTRTWWTGARTALTTTVNPQPIGQAIYARALTDLVFSNTSNPLNPVTTVPETLLLDYNRLLSLRARTLHMIAVASMLLTTKIRLRRNREALWTKDAERLMALDLLSPSTTHDRIVGMIESSHMMPDATKEGLADFVRRVLPPAVAAAKNAHEADRNHAAAIQDHRPYLPTAQTSAPLEPEPDAFAEQISTYLLKSLHAHIYARLSASTTADRVRASTTAAEVLARAGMPEFVAEVGGIVDSLERIRALDLRAHGSWLEEIAAQQQ